MSVPSQGSQGTLGFLSCGELNKGKASVAAIKLAGDAHSTQLVERRESGLRMRALPGGAGSTCWELALPFHMLQTAAAGRAWWPQRQGSSPAASCTWQRPWQSHHASVLAHCLQARRGGLVSAHIREVSTAAMQSQPCGFLLEIFSCSAWSSSTVPCSLFVPPHTHTYTHAHTAR